MTGGTMRGDNGRDKEGRYWDKTKGRAAERDGRTRLWDRTAEKDCGTKRWDKATR